MEHREHLENTKEINIKSIFLQIDKDTNRLIKIHGALSTKFKKGTVVRCCNNELQTTQGFKWLFLEDYKELKYKDDIEIVLNYINSKKDRNYNKEDATPTTKSKHSPLTIIRKLINAKEISNLLYYVTSSCNLSETFICNSIDMEYKEFKKKFNTDTFTVDDNIKISEFLQNYFIGADKIDIKELYRDELNNID